MLATKAAKAYIEVSLEPKPQRSLKGRLVQLDRREDAESTWDGQQ